MLIKLTLHEGGRARDRLTRISHRKYGKMERDAQEVVGRDLESCQFGLGGQRNALLLRLQLERKVTWLFSWLLCSSRFLFQFLTLTLSLLVDRDLVNATFSGSWHQDRKSHQDGGGLRGRALAAGQLGCRWRLKYR